MKRSLMSVNCSAVLGGNVTKGKMMGLLESAKKLRDRGHFNYSACADKETNQEMAEMLEAIDFAEKIPTQYLEDIQMAYGILFRVTTSDKRVHQARHVLRVFIVRV